MISSESKSLSFKFFFIESRNTVISFRKIRTFCIKPQQSRHIAQHIRFVCLSHLSLNRISIFAFDISNGYCILIYINWEPHPLATQILLGLLSPSRSHPQDLIRWMKDYPNPSPKTQNRHPVQVFEPSGACLQLQAANWGDGSSSNTASRALSEIMSVNIMTSLEVTILKEIFKNCNIKTIIIWSLYTNFELYCNVWISRN